MFEIFDLVHHLMVDNLLIRAKSEWWRAGLSCWWQNKWFIPNISLIRSEIWKKLTVGIKIKIV